MKILKLFLPNNKKEQQKIALCLSSLDELLEARKQKLELLKKHKKGLMQNLFPMDSGELKIENEKNNSQLSILNSPLIPRLRFPEFKDSGEWEEKKLENITDAIFDGTHQTPTYVEDGIPFFSVENIASGNKNKFISKEDYEKATSKNKPAKGDILITRIGKIGFSAIVDWDYDFSIYVTLACIKKSNYFNSYYLHCYFQSLTYQNEILSKSLLNAVPCKINMNELRQTKILLPSLPEQQKIASCLSSLDELIMAEAEKIEQLEKHKKGLMQGVFPIDN
ncbi:MAG: restriction endonuclease subunit S [Bacteroidales bacterium]|nr:restriction endonuclease subunit S [Bacteroidales bacterium]